MKITIDKQAVCVIIDTDIQRALGTGFSFLKDNWVVTAKHVVIKDNYPRENIQLSFLEREPVTANVIAVHPELDIALMEYEGESLCRRPLMPGYHEFNHSGNLYLIGYSPSNSDHDGRNATVNLITDYTTEERHREDTEILFRFKAEYSEGGNSGGPVLGEGGNVVGIAIETYDQEDGKYCLATSIRSILSNISLGDKWEAF